MNIYGVALSTLILVTALAVHGADIPEAVLGQKGVYSVTDFGAKGDAISDDTEAFQKALNQAGKTGGIVFVPAGAYMIKGHLDIPPQVTLQGVFQAPPSMTGALRGVDVANYKGSVLLAVEGKGNENGTPFIFMRHDSVLKGLAIYYPEQDRKNPVPYPWCVAGEGDNCSIVDVLLVNPWQAVDFGTRPCGRHYIKGLYAQPIKTGIFIDKCFDVGRIEDVHLWPFWDIPLMKDFTYKNGTGLKIGRTDWQFISNVFTIFFKVGFHFLAVGNDGPGNAVITNSGADIGPCAVLIEKCQPHAGLQFVNCQFMAGIDIRESNNGPVKFTNCGFWGLPDQTINHAKVLGNGHVTFNSCHFITWDAEGKGEPCIYSDGAALTVSNCDFMNPDKNQITLGENQKSAVIMGNLMRGGIKITNKSKGKVEIGLNVED
jgi:hypothetical protein